jgi:hypothetical protein
MVSGIAGSAPPARFPGPWPEAPADPLHTLALTQGAPDDHGDVRIRNIQAFIQEP